MGQRRDSQRNSSKVEENEKSMCEENLEFGGTSLHEMETQVMHLEQDAGCLPGTSSMLEGRRTRSGKSLDATGDDNTKLRKKQVKAKPKVAKFTRGRKPFVPSMVRKYVPKITDNRTSAALSSTETNADKECSDGTEAPVPLVDFMANLNVSPSTSRSVNKQVTSNFVSEKMTPGPSTDCPQTVELTAGNEATSTGKFRSPVVETEGITLARSYRKSLRNTEEFALNYICQEFHHPVITCFRELTSSDISHIVRSQNKLKKSCNSLEQSVVYLGLIDLLATVNKNPVYGESETSKISKKLPSTVKKILLYFKNIMGTWALSCNDTLTKRYSLIVNYLRTLAPMFKKAEFEQEFNTIIDCIEAEVNRHKQNQEKIKSMGSSTSRETENSNDKKLSSTDSQDGECRSALNEIILNVDLNVKIDESDDEDEVSFLKEDKSLEIFGKPLKGLSRPTDLSKRKGKKLQAAPDNKSFKSPSSTIQTKQKQEKSPKSHTSSKKTVLPQPKTLSKVFQSFSSPKTFISMSDDATDKTLPVKRSAHDDLDSIKETSKKRKIEDGSGNVKEKGSEGNLSIKSFFQSVTSTSGGSISSSSPKPTVTSEKPTVNAFALMMNRSREIALKKKIDKMNALPVPLLKVDTVKS